MENPKITVAIPTYQREEVLVETVRNVFDQKFSEFELIVVDQTLTHKKSTDEYLKSIEDPRFRYFRVHPPSLPAARNFAIEKSRSDIVLFIDDDVQLAENFIYHHYNTHISKPEIKAVAGRIQLRGVEPTSELFYFTWAGFERESFNCPIPQEATAFQGCNFSFKKDVVDTVGNFNTNYIKSSTREESDFAYRIRKHGYKIWFEPKASLIHFCAASGGCRIHNHPFDSLSFYENDLFYTFRVMRFLFVPIVLGFKFVFYVMARSPKTMMRRVLLFMKGMKYAIHHTVKPRDITVKVIEQNSNVS